MHSADYAMARCLSVGSTVTRRYCVLHISSKLFILVFPYRMGWQYSDGDPPNGRVECKRVWKNHNFRPISRFISELMQDRAIVTTEGEWEIAPKLLNSTISNDLVWPLTQISRSRYHSTSKISKTVPDSAIFTMTDQYKVVYGLLNGAIFNDLEQPL